MTFIKEPLTEAEGIRKVSFEKILVPLDGSDMAAGILAVALDMARRVGAKLDLLAVVDPETIELPSYMPFMGSERSIVRQPHDEVGASEIEIMRIKTATQYLNAIAESIRDDGQEVSVEAIVGDPAQAIIEAAHKNRNDLIAMATSGRSAIGRGLLGSVTDKVAHSSAVPMLIITPDFDGEQTPISRLVIGLDGSPMAETALEPARRLAKLLDVPILMVRATAMASRMAAYGGEPYYASPDVYTEADEDAKAYLQGMKEIEERRGIKVETIVKPGYAVSEINSAAKEVPGSLIVLATRGRTGFTRWVLGSVTDRVIRSAESPVLVIPPKIGGWD